MAATMAGIVVASDTRRIYMVIKPDEDNELDQGWWRNLQATDPTTSTPVPTFVMVKMPLTQYNGYTSFAALQAAVL